MICGILGAFVVGAVSYTYLSGFPFQRPDGFSYNAFAVMYLSGLYCALLFGLICGSRVLAGTLALVFLLHIVATTSIKTNLGLAAGVLVVSAIFFLRTARIVARNVVYLVVLGAALAYAITSSDELSRRVDVGIQRISLGVEILQSRQDQSGSTSYGLREEWTSIGLEGWASNPVFGEGVEAFRATHGAHSHTVPVELLYNTGLIGFVLFYSVFASLMFRVLLTGQTAARNLHALVVAGTVCYMLMTFGGTPQYEYYLGIFLATSVALLERNRSGRGSDAGEADYVRSGSRGPQVAG